MAADVPVGYVQTVLGPVGPEQLGVTMTHEHLLVDLTPVHGPPSDIWPGLFNKSAALIL